MSQSRLAYLFNRYINKEYTPEEKTELFRLVDTEDINGELKDLLDHLIASTGAEVSLPAESGHSILQSVINHQALQASHIPCGKSSRNLRKLWWSIAAAAVVFVFTVAYLHFANDDSKISGKAVSAAKSNHGLSVGTATGQWKSIRLTDGTQVWLSPSSTLEYPAVFAGNLREISLSGEAFFEVAHDAQRPFIIHSGNIETKVLGTSFNIQAYDNQEDISVTVVTGKVNVTDRTKVENVELIANERAVFHRHSTKLEKENTGVDNAPNMLKRKDGMFVYTYERLQKVIDDLREYFGVDIELAPEIKGCKVMANFYVKQDIQEILEPIALSINGSVQENNNRYFITGKGCPK